MDDATTNDAPWPAPATDAAATHDQIDARTTPASPVAIFALAAVVGFGAGVGVGALVGWLVYGVSARSCPPSDGWCELGAAALGLGGGGLAGAIAYVLAGVMTIGRWRPRGDRSRLVVAHLALPVALVALLSVIGGAI